MAGPTKPPRLPIELIVAMPAAAAGPDRNMGGMVHSGGLHEVMPMFTTVSAATTVNTVASFAASTRPAAASRQASTTCQVRSPVLSECHDHSTVTITATVGGIELRKPTVIDDRPSCLMIVGAQIPSV